VDPDCETLLLAEGEGVEETVGEVDGDGETVGVGKTTGPGSVPLPTIVIDITTKPGSLVARIMILLTMACTVAMGAMNWTFAWEAVRLVLVITLDPANRREATV
jgi:hypothetical protein